MVKRNIAGIEVPLVASALELRYWVHLVYVTLHENCAATAALMGVTPATIWKLENDEQMDSQILRDSLGIRKTPPRPRVWMPTNNCEAAVDKLMDNYPISEIMEAMIAINHSDGVVTAIEYKQWPAND